MDRITFDQLPDAVSSILDKLDRIEKKLQEQSPKPSETTEQLLTYADISKEFKISQKTLKLLKKIGQLKPLCKGGRYLLFERNHVIQVLQTRPRIKPQFLKNQ